jgi:hypothetical protein
MCGYADMRMKENRFLLNKVLFNSVDFWTGSRANGIACCVAHIIVQIIIEPF